MTSCCWWSADSDVDNPDDDHGGDDDNKRMMISRVCPSQEPSHKASSKCFFSAIDPRS